VSVVNAVPVSLGMALVIDIEDDGVDLMVDVEDAECIKNVLELDGAAGLSRVRTL